MAKRLQGNKNLRIADLGPATAAKVAVERIGNFFLAGEESLNQALQTLTAFEGSGIWSLRKSRSLAGETHVQSRNGRYGVGTHWIRTAAFLSPPSVIINLARPGPLLRGLIND